ncbi:hypothetical protein RBB50_010078 [Rhinocladiella similis]
MVTKPATREVPDDVEKLEALSISSIAADDGMEYSRLDPGTTLANGEKASQSESSSSRRQWRTISPRTNEPSRHNALQRAVAPSPSESKESPCWTDHLPKNENTEWFLKGTDWSLTELGPLGCWPFSLRTLINLAVADDHAVVIYWGPSFLSCFNRQAYKDFRDRFNVAHDVQGNPFTEVWKKEWSDMQGLYEKLQAESQSIDIVNMPVFPRYSDGRLEETFWRGSFLPIRGDDGKLAGWYNRASEITNDIVNERRAKTLYAISSPPAKHDTSAWKHMFQALRENVIDFPMAFVYSADDGGDACRLTLQQSLGLPVHGHHLVPEVLDMYEAPSGFLFYYRKAKSTQNPVILHQDDGSLPSELLDGFEWQGYGDRPASMAFLPISVGRRLLGILVFGLNPRRRYQPKDDAFVTALCRQASAAVASAVDLEEAQHRAEKLTMQLEENERQIREVAEYGPVGMLRVTPQGHLLWANSNYYSISGHSCTDKYAFSFMDVVHRDERDLAMSFWALLVDEHKPTSQEFRLEQKWKPPPRPGHPDPQEENCWILANAFPSFTDGVLSSIVCCITNISRIKWTEEIQSRLAAEATEARKLQEAFIDVVSHEMRNPLSAIMQLADGIASSLEDWDSLDDHSADSALQLLKEKAENGRTILLCAAHQKRVIDDVLTLSKLDSQLLSIWPAVVQPDHVVESTLTMCQAEFDTNSITVEHRTDESYTRLNLDWVALDPARLTQIFVNLLTNAVKFTKLESKRKITITRGAFTHPPPPLENITWFPTKQERRDATTGSEWGTGDVVYLLFTISDTGKGLEQNEMTRLFNRFQQATKKTHIKYGGSGLGLFVSRELTENMGGQIGVASTPGKGTTFAFYIKVRKAPPPPTAAADDHKQQLQRVSTHTSTYLGSSMAASSSSTAEMSQITRFPSKENAIATTAVQVLLVEDNIINAQVLTKQLKRAGCTVYIANHGQEALDFLPRTKAWHDYEPLQTVDSPSATLDVDIDCILMDIEMPVLDGLTCTRQIRKLHKDGLITKHLPIIAITANAREEQIASAMEAGVDAVLPKPFRAVDALTKMDEVVRR